MPGPSASDMYGGRARCRSRHVYLHVSRVLAVEVDPDRHQIRLHEAYGRRVQSRDRVPRDDVPQSLSWVIVGHEPGRALAPSPADANANVGIRLDVPDVVGPAPVLGDDPEDPAVETVGDRVAPRLAGLAPGGLQDRRPGRWKSEAKQPAHHGIDQVLRRPAGKPPLYLTATYSHSMVP